VNFDLPHVPDDYVHRVGRTARAERSGHAWSFVAHEEQRQLRDIERLLRKPIPIVPLPVGLPQPAPRTPLPSRHAPHPGMRHPQQRFRPAPPRGAPSYRQEDRGRGWTQPSAPRGSWTPPDTSDVFFIQKKPFGRPGGRGGRPSRGGFQRGGFRRGGFRGPRR
jgi:ATP-dependent RNA helicase RhlE